MDLPPALQDYYADQEVAVAGGNVGKKIVEHGGTAAIVAGDIGIAGLQVGTCFIGSTPAAEAGSEIAGTGLARSAPFYPSGSMTNRVNGVCAFLNSVKSGRLVTASADVAEKSRKHPYCEQPNRCADRRAIRTGAAERG